jgi:hypothetical protein
VKLTVFDMYLGRGLVKNVYQAIKKVGYVWLKGWNSNRQGIDAPHF